MKPGTFSKRVLLPVLAVGSIVALASWDYQQTPSGNKNYNQFQEPTDTTPKKKKKVQDLDQALEELDKVNIDDEMKKVQEELSKALKQIDGEKIRLQVESAMKQVDVEKIMKEVQESLSKIDMDKVKVELEKIKEVDMKEIQEELAKIGPEIQKEMAKVKEEMAKIKPDMEKEMKRVQEELKRIQPEIEKEMANAKEELGKAKVEIEKAKAEIREYKEFVDGLDRDGLINKKENYTVKYKDGELTINGKKASADVMSKYKSFLDKHKKFSIEKSDDDFDIDMD
jgi:chromosome segregation ATPase